MYVSLHSSWCIAGRVQSVSAVRGDETRVATPLLATTNLENDLTTFILSIFHVCLAHASPWRYRDASFFSSQRRFSFY